MGIFEITALLFTALALIPSGAHLLEFRSKIRLPAHEYLTVQRLYRGWALLGVVVMVALLATLSLAFLLRSQPRAFPAAIIAAGCIVGTQLVFWVMTFPVNRRTENWAILPRDWQRLRDRWEYSHVICAILNFAALVATCLAIVWGDPG